MNTMKPLRNVLFKINEQTKLKQIHRHRHTGQVITMGKGVGGLGERSEEIKK